MSARSVTRHDILKTIAIILMVVDHVGFFLFPDQPLLRAIGRCSAPIWLFMVGYNQKSTIDRPLLLTTFFMVIIAPLLTGLLVPLNILLAIILVRLSLPSMPLLLMPLRGFKRGAVPALLLVALAFAAYPTNYIWEYGSFCWLFAGLGWWQREVENPSSPYAAYRRAPVVLAAITMVLYAIHFALILQLSAPVVMTMCGLLAVTAFGLLRFRAGVITRTVPAPIAEILHFCGRQSLLLYAAHFVLLGIIFQLTHTG